MTMVRAPSVVDGRAAVRWTVCVVVSVSLGILEGLRRSGGPDPPARSSTNPSCPSTDRGADDSRSAIVTRMTFKADPRVDAYIDSLPDWQQAICRKVRALVHAADPEVVETIKRTDRPYFVLDGNICALLAAKGHVNVFIYDPIAPDPDGIITAGHENKTARTVAIGQGETINEEALTNIFRAVIANNRAGGWRKLQRKH
jgi:hypothetical protein